MASTIEGFTTFKDGINVNTTFSAPAGSVTNTMISSNTEIVAEKLEHQHAFHHSQTSTVTAATEYVHIVRNTGEVVAVEAAVTEVLPSGDYQISVDVQKSTGAGSFSTILSATIDLTSGSTLRTPVAGTISATGLVDNDLLRVVVTVSGSSGSQGQGLLVTITTRESTT